MRRLLLGVALCLGIGNPVEAQELTDAQQALSTALFEKVGFGIAYSLGVDDPHWFQSKLVADAVLCMTNALSADIPDADAVRLTDFVRSNRDPTPDETALISKMLDTENAERNAQVRTWIRAHCPKFERPLLDTKSSGS